MVEDQRSTARLLILPFGIAAGYVLAVPTALCGLGMLSYHAWCLDKWTVLLEVHLLIGCIAALVRAVDGDLRAWLRGRVPIAIMGGILFILFFTAFGSWKHAFWRWGWFVWDPLFAGWDRSVHLGRYPHQWLDVIISHRIALVALDGLYFAWGLVMVGTLSSVLWVAPARRCRQYVLAFLGTWILIGSVVAPVTGSGGPAYYSRLVSGPDPYTTLLQARSETTSAVTQEWLWQATNTPTFIPASGISAMPSVHVAQATLIALLAWTHRLWLVRVIGILFLVGMQLATVVLGWHYAIDGYVAVLLTWGMWRMADQESTATSIGHWRAALRRRFASRPRLHGTRSGPA